MTDQGSIADRREEYSREQYFEALLKEIKEDPCNYQPYVSLGEWYEAVNIDQAYLTYEHARYLCRREMEKEEMAQAAHGAISRKVSGLDPSDPEAAMSFLNRKLSRLKQDHRFHVHPASFIILSYNTLDLTQKCLESIRATCDRDACEIVIVDNNSSDGSKEWLREQKNIVFVDNDYNAGFPGGCNLGFHAASPKNDMLLLNSDTEMTQNAFYTLRMGLYSDRRNGMAGGFSNANYPNSLASHVPEIPGEEGYYDYGKMVNIPGGSAVCRKTVLHAFYVIVRRDVFNIVGEWDERFNPGNYDDHDYSYRVLMAGYRNVICWNSFIIHRAHRTFNRNKMGHQSIMEVNFNKFRQKWHFDTDECSAPHDDMISLIGHQREEEFSVLFIGCGAGECLIRIEEKFPLAKVSGTDKSPLIAKIGAAMSDVAACDIENEDIPFERKKYDYVMIANTLERCGDPELVLRRAGRYLAPGGKVICRIYNIQNAKVIGDMLRGNFFGKDMGVRDSRNVNFFTLQDMYRLFRAAGYGIEFVFSLCLVEASVNADKAFFDRICGISGVSDRKQFNAHHYVFRLEKKENGK